MSGLDWCPGCHAERSEISAIESAHLIPKFTLMQRFTESLLKIRLEGARTTKRYFKHWAESDSGSGIAYIEFDGELPTRQVEKYGDRWFSSIKRSHPEVGPGLIESTLSKSGLEPQHEIAQAEFEEVWNEALKHVQ